MIKQMIIAATALALCTTASAEWIRGEDVNPLDGNSVVALSPSEDYDAFVGFKEFVDTGNIIFWVSSSDSYVCGDSIRMDLKFEGFPAKSYYVDVTNNSTLKLNRDLAVDTLLREAGESDVLAVRTFDDCDEVNLMVFDTSGQPDLSK